jgi:hypothetical protein
MLTPEFETIKALSPYMRPQDSLGIRRSAPKAFRISNQSIVTYQSPSPNPLPSRERVFYSTQIPEEPHL